MAGVHRWAGELGLSAGGRSVTASCAIGSMSVLGTSVLAAVIVIVSEVPCLALADRLATTPAGGTTGLNLGLELCPELLVLVVVTTLSGRALGWHQAPRSCGTRLWRPAGSWPFPRSRLQVPE